MVQKRSKLSLNSGFLLSTAMAYLLVQRNNQIKDLDGNLCLKSQVYHFIFLHFM